MIERVIHEYALKDSRVTVVKNETNVGLANSLNRGLNMAKGEYIARMDADDISCSDRLRQQLEYMLNNRLDFVGSYITRIDEAGDDMNISCRLPRHDFFIRKTLRFYGCIMHPTWLVRNQVFSDLNGYRNVPSTEDYDLLLRARKKEVKFGVVDKALVKYRHNYSGITMSSNARQRVVALYLQKNFRSIDDLNIDDYLQTDDAKKKMEIAEKHAAISEKAWEYRLAKNKVMHFRSLIQMLFGSRYGFCAAVNLAIFKLFVVADCIVHRRTPPLISY